MIAFLDLPTEILALIIDELDIDDSISLSETSKALNALVTAYGWRGHLQRCPRQSAGIAWALSSWSPLAQVQYHVRTDHKWARRSPAAFPLARPWRGKLQPVVASSASRVVVAAGLHLYSYSFATYAEEGKAPCVRAEFVCTLGATDGDATALVFIPDGGEDLAVVVGFSNGALDYIRLPEPPAEPPVEGPTEVAMPRSDPNRARFHQYPGELVASLSYSDGQLVSFTSIGSVTLFDLSTWSPFEATTLDVARGWKALLSPDNSFAAFGTSSLTPLVVYALTPTGLSPSPISVPFSLARDDFQPSRTAVYGLAPAPPAAPWGSPEHTLLSGWYDGFVHVHDLREPSSRPALSFCDPWQFEPVYAVAGAGAHIAAGAARHSVVALWDARSPRSPGFSVHAPGNDPSPVYSLALEDGRLFGATQGRAFALDFGPGVGKSTYPAFQLPTGKRKARGVGYPVTIYGHENGSKS
ncbi:hypothetical protein PENSPDRAFT_648549 [Peniophora sp. CONT]|nr:hypothetical protein PENSPDRAFT_648549 [Peniophora sp. CONT]